MYNEIGFGNVTGLIVLRGRMYQVQVPWAYLVTDTVAWAKSIRTFLLREAEEGHSLRDVEYAEMNEECVNVLDKWLQDFDYFAPFDPTLISFCQRLELKPLGVNRINAESWVERLLELSTPAPTESLLDFVLCTFSSGNLTLTGNEKIQVALEHYSGNVTASETLL